MRCIAIAQHCFSNLIDDKKTKQKLFENRKSPKK